MSYWQQFVPPDFQVPARLEAAGFHLRMLTVNDLVKDYDAVMSSSRPAERSGGHPTLPPQRSGCRESIHIDADRSPAGIAWARNAGAEMIFLQTNSRLGNSIRLYERLGFRHAVAPDPPDYARADVYMELPIANGGG